MMKDGAMSLPDSQEEESSPSPNMQMELHSKGAVLTKAWSDLFSFITTYQAELTVKENAVEIAEREIDLRKKQLEEMKPVMEAGNEEIDKLQEDIRTKERLLGKAQSELGVQGQMLQRVQSDLNCNMELLDKARSDLLDRQTELIRNRSDLDRLKSELTIKQEQLQIKDNLLRKLQNQLMKENAELKEQLDLKERTLDMERRSHEITKRTLRERSKKTTSAVPAVIEIPDSPPTLDLSAEQSDFGLSGIISEASSHMKRPHRMEYESPAKRFHYSAQESSLSRMSSMTSDTLTDYSRHIADSQSPMTTPIKSQQWSMPSPSSSSPGRASQSHTPTHVPPISSSSFHESFQESDSFNIPQTSASDTFFPLSVSQSEEDSKAGIDTSVGAMYADGEMQDSGQYMPGTPTSETSDSNQGAPVPISGPIPSSGMPGPSGLSPGGGMQEGADGKYDARFRNCLQCDNCGNLSPMPPNMGVFMMSKPGELICESCGVPFSLKKLYGPPKKRTRVEITARQKREICQFQKDNPRMSHEEVRQHFISNWGVALGRSTVHDIIKHSDKWLSIGPETACLDSSRVRTCKVPQLESALGIWIRDVLAHGFQPDGGMIMEKAKRLGKELGVESLTYSHGWLYRFKKRHGLLKSKKCENGSKVDQTKNKVDGNSVEKLEGHFQNGKKVEKQVSDPDRRPNVGGTDLLKGVVKEFESPMVNFDDDSTLARGEHGRSDVNPKDSGSGSGIPKGLDVSMADAFSASSLLSEIVADTSLSDMSSVHITNQDLPGIPGGFGLNVPPTINQRFSDSISQGPVNFGLNINRHHVGMNTDGLVEKEQSIASSPDPSCDQYL